MEVVMGYIMDIRKIVGSRPLIMAGACVILVNSNNAIGVVLRKQKIKSEGAKIASNDIPVDTKPHRCALPTNNFSCAYRLSQQERR
ncbi:hypothetical protein [Lysinibacillus fusiformis]|uniref:hypothetical protein n=1 Tax=Lysinibacillus fusiformis TaxID=28031 RepID=UPI003D08C7DC